jgi:hypothetical protein
MLSPTSSIRLLVKSPLASAGVLVCAFVACCGRASAANHAFRPPAVPLVAVDPYFSIWSFANHLTYQPTRHWTGARMTMQSIIRVDGQAYRIMGAQPRNLEPAEQVSLRVLPTRTIYIFQAGGLRIALTFLTPDLPHDLDVLARPVTYLTWRVRSIDGKPHDVSIYYDNTAELVVNTPNEAVEWSRPTVPGLVVLKMGTSAQPVLDKAGDFIRIDWGYLYVAAPQSEDAIVAVGRQRALVDSFVSHIPSQVADLTPPIPANAGSPVMAFTFNLGSIGATPVSRHLILAYDEVYPVEYFHQRVRAWWRHSGATIGDLLEDAERDYPQLAARCRAFDAELMHDLTTAGGSEYAEVSALAYRQAFAANKLAIGPSGQPLMFLKEISSCGCAQTADVIYPESPILLFLNPKLLEDSLVPLLDYARSGKWPYSYAPHDLGTYPLDNARVPSKMESMPVEETGNMMLMIAAIAKAEGNASFSLRYWALISQWAGYLKAHGLDPGDQLCTDDFTGLLAHNANLALKAVEALGAYAMLARMLGQEQTAAAYEAIARRYAQEWMQKANDGNHTRLAYDRPGTWSQKYNLVWDRVLGIDLFPPRVAREELAYYRQHERPFGFPLDSRSDYTKLDWETWCASLAPSAAGFESVFSSLYHYANRTPSRVPLSDWYWTVDGTQTGFQARPVVGALFMRMLCSPSVWQNWARAEKH